MTRLARFEALLDISQQMVEQARQQSWEVLAQLETQRAALIDQLPHDFSTSSTTEQAAIAGAIHQIEDCNKAVLEYVMPWREHAEALLVHLKPAP